MKRVGFAAVVLGVLVGRIVANGQAPATPAITLSVIVSNGFRGAYDSLLPAFEKVSGIGVRTTTGSSVGSGATTIANQVRNGATADVIILARQGLDELIAERRILPGSDVDLARSLIGVIVPAGAPRPDIGTVETFKQALLRAPSVAVSTSASGVYLTTSVFPKLGISEAMAGKVMMSEAGAQLVGSGAAAMGLQQVSEVIRVKGADFVGPIPADVQLVTIFSAAVVNASSHHDAARRLVAYLSSTVAAPSIRQSGMEPITSR